MRNELGALCCDEDNAFGGVLDEMESERGERKSQTMDFTAVSSDNGRKQTLLVARAEEKGEELRMGKRKEEKKAGEKRRGSNGTVENGGNVQRRRGGEFSGQKGSGVGNTAPEIVFRENLDIGGCFGKRGERKVRFFRG